MNLTRRNRIDLMVPAELAIRNAMLEVEKLPADTRLTEAVVLLGKAQDKVAEYVDALRPRIITLCGSTRFTAQMLDEAWRLTKLGNIVIHWNILNESEALAHGAEREGNDVKRIIDDLYLHKVAMADEVRVINVGDYIGESTRREVNHAMFLGKQITWLEPHKAWA